MHVRRLQIIIEAHIFTILTQRRMHVSRIKPFETWVNGSPLTDMRSMFVLFVTLCTVIISLVITFHPSPTPPPPLPLQAFSKE